MHGAKSSSREGGRRCTCVSHEGGDAAALDAAALHQRKEGDAVALHLRA